MKLDPNAINNLKELESKIGKDLLGGLSKIFIDTTPEIIQRMKTAMEDNNRENLTLEAHTLKSSSANLGATELSDVCKDLEHRLISESPPTDEDIASLVHQIDELVPEVIQELKQFL